MTYRLALIALVAAILATPTVLADEGWMTDFEAAKAKAAEEGKDLLLDFTGSDWCGWCIKLKDEVFSQEAFKAEAPKHFVLVELDFPRRKQLPDDLKAQNDELRRKYEIQGYPSIILIDAEGNLYGRTGYRPGGPDSYLEHLAELRNNKNKWVEATAAAGDAQGAEKAKLLDQAAEARMANGLPADEIVEQILELDADGSAGLKSKYMARKLLGEIEGLARSGDMEGALAKAETVLNDLEPEGDVKQQAMWFKGAIKFQMGQKEEAIEILREAHGINAESDLGKHIKKVLEQIGG